MDLDQVKLILNLVREHELSELEVEHEGLRIRVRRDVGPAAAPVASPAGPAALPAATAAPPVAVPPPAEAPAPDADLELAVVKSPIVGTFYRSADPGSAAFVEVGSRVKKGQVLCIIEAMKLMNQIDSEYDGEIVKVFVENSQPVQYGERLFAIKLT
jgi:acetyl-CoA carboxylase biotin carboxyl carrier protein